MKPLANINTRISALLSISLRSYNRLKRKKKAYYIQQKMQENKLQNH